MKRFLAIAACLVLAGLPTGAEEKPAGHKHTLSLGATLTDGNSETLQANATILTATEKEGLGSFRAGAEVNYGESTVNSNKETTVENARAFANIKKTLSPQTFLSLNGEALHDSIAKISYRATLSPGLGAYLVKRKKTTFELEAGPAYVWEKIDGATGDYLAVRLAERFEHALSDTAKVWQSCEYVPRVNDFDNFALNFEIGAEAALNAFLNLRLVLQDRYNNTPAKDLKNNDLSLIAGISVAL